MQTLDAPSSVLRYVNDIEWGLGKVTRATQIIHGRGLGGTSSVNGRYYTRTYLPFDPEVAFNHDECRQNSIATATPTFPNPQLSSSTLDRNPLNAEW